MNSIPRHVPFTARILSPKHLIYVDRIQCSEAYVPLITYPYHPIHCTAWRVRIVQDTQMEARNYTKKSHGMREECITGT